MPSTVYERTREDAEVVDKTYQSTPIGQEIKRCLEALQWDGAPLNTRDAYETAWARFSLDFADVEGLAAFVADKAWAVAEVSRFLARHWGKSAPATRAARRAAIGHLFGWAADVYLIDDWNPVDRIKRPRGRGKRRSAHPAGIVTQLLCAQDSVEDQIAIGFLGQLGIRKEGVLLMQARNVNRVTGEVGFRLKGGGWGVLPYDCFESLALSVEVFIDANDLQPTDYLVGHRDGTRTRPLNPSTFHRRFKTWLARAGLPDFPMHELRHSAGDFARRQTDIYVAKDLLGHSSVDTTEVYMHSDMAELRAKLAVVGEAWQEELVRHRAERDG